MKDAPAARLHPMRTWARIIVGEERQSGPALDALGDQLDTVLPPKTAGDAVATAIAATVGTFEGVASAANTFAGEQIAKATPRENGTGTAERGRIGRAAFGVATYGSRTAEKAPKEAAKFLALAGLARPDDPKATDALIDQVVTMARGNRARVRLGARADVAYPSHAEFAAMGRTLLGHNQGADRIAEVIIVNHDDDYRAVEIHAFDEVGHHVLDLAVSMEAPGVLYVDALQASHGRNCESLLLAFGGPSVPGRGNAVPIAAGLESLIVEGAKAGLFEIRTTPGSPQVQRLYEKMGFTSPGDLRPWRRKLVAWTAQQLPIVSGLFSAAELAMEAMKRTRGSNKKPSMALDLTNPDAVRQALVGFRLARAVVRDVPKGVAEQLRSLEIPVALPSIDRYRKEFPEGRADVRILRES